MATNALILCAAAAAALLLGASGAWRTLLWPFTIRARRMTVARLGLIVAPGEDTERVNTILRHFLTGFNRTLTSRSLGRALAATSSSDPLYRPFAEEGMAMGYTPHRLFRFDPAAFESDLVRARPEFRYLYYVGLGFWSGLRNHGVDRLLGVTERLDPLHRFLVFDGYGFKVAFFDHPSQPGALSRLDTLPGYARNAALQGVGRALFFRFMGEPPHLIAALRQLGDDAADAAGGVGLAAVFVNPDRLETARTLARSMPMAWRSHFHLGMCFALKARSVNDVDAFQQCLGRTSDAVCAASYAAIRECDRVELLVRDEFYGASHLRRPVEVDQGYRAWRERVAAWMDRNIEFPLSHVKVSKSAAVTGHSQAATSVNMGASLTRSGGTES